MTLQFELLTFGVNSMIQQKSITLILRQFYVFCLLILCANVYSITVPINRGLNNLQPHILNPAFTASGNSWEFNYNHTTEYVSDNIIWGMEPRFFKETSDLRTGISSTSRSYGNRLSIHNLDVQKNLGNFKNWGLGTGLGLIVENLDLNATGLHYNLAFKVERDIDRGHIALGLRCTYIRYQAIDVLFPDVSEYKIYNYDLRRFNADFGVKYTEKKKRTTIGLSYNNINNRKIESEIYNDTQKLRYYRNVPGSMNFLLIDNRKLNQNWNYIKTFNFNINPEFFNQHAEHFSILFLRKIRDQDRAGAGLYYASSNYGGLIGPMFRLETKGLKVQYILNIPIGKIVKVISLAHEIAVTYNLNKTTKVSKPIFTPND